MNGSDKPDITPRPDPTVLTTQQLIRELGALRELIDARFAAYDMAVALLRDRANQSPAVGEVAQSVTHLKELVESRFDAVAQKFEGNAIALIAAFAASKEAVSEQQKSNTTAISKSEAATGEQLKQLQALWGTSSAALSDKIEDLRVRTSAIEAVKQGQKEQQATSQHSNAFMVTLVVAAVAVSGLLVNVINTWTSPPTVERVVNVK